MCHVCVSVWERERFRQGYTTTTKITFTLHLLSCFPSLRCLRLLLHEEIDDDLYLTHRDKDITTASIILLNLYLPRLSSSDYWPYYYFCIKFQSQYIYSTIKSTQLKKKKINNYLENIVPQSHLYSLVPQVLEWAFQSDCTAYLFAHFSHFHFFSPCFRQKCFFIPVRSPRALEAWWWTQLFSGHT